MDSLANFAPGISDVLQARTKRGWRGVAEFQFEIVLFLLLLATFAAVRFQDAILIKTITLTTNVPRSKSSKCVMRPMPSPTSATRLSSLA